jgi:DNA-3-methyladenine glycosylase I
MATTDAVPQEPPRCPWCLSGNARYIRYHDAEWGVPAYDDQTQLEFLILEGAQAGLSWATILNKREGYREAFGGFDAERIARFGKPEVERLLANPGIVRNRLKIEAAVRNARAFLKLQASVGFANHMWSFVGGKPIQHRLRSDANVPTTTPESDALSKDLKKRGFSFVGSTIIYAHMQATGMVNDHLLTCFRHEPCRALAR